MKPETDEELAPYYAVMGPLQATDFASSLSTDGWRELARTLKECSRSQEHARRIVAEFMRTPRYDGSGSLITKVPAAIELRVFGSGVTEASGVALCQPCLECEIGGGNWRRSRGGLERCNCKRGLQLRAMDAARAVPAKPQVVMP